jgi:3-oxoacyl-[acyl-carrier-protein] synthase II
MSEATEPRVVVTGIGLVTPVGNDRESAWRALKNGVSGIVVLGDRDRGQVKGEVAGEVRGFIPPAGTEHLDRYLQMAIACARAAVAEARLQGNLLRNAGCVMSTSKGGLETLLTANENWVKHRTPYPPETLPRYLLSAGATAVAEDLALRGPLSCPVAACATGLLVIDRAAGLIRDGACTTVIAGGADSSLLGAVFAGFRRLRALAEVQGDNPAAVCRPFDMGRTGFVLAEGAGALVLEELEQARRRGATIYGEVAGCASGADGWHETALDAEHSVLPHIISLAMQRAGLTPEMVDYINAHGTGTHQNDLIETVAIKQALGPAAKGISISSTKSMIGHLLAGAALVETAVVFLSMRDGFVPPTINLTSPDPECDLDYTPNVGRTRPVRAALNISSGFGGHAAVLAARQLDGL